MTSDSSTAQRQRAQLRDFLRSRRARLTPGEVGMPAVGIRRTPGLRREEVAMLAGVGVSWYTWLEQGRDINASPEVLDAIGRALRLTGPERRHLYLLAGHHPPPAGGVRDAAVTPQLRNILEAWTPRPAILRDRYWNHVAVNEAVQVVFGHDHTDYNCLISFFTNAQYRGMHLQWESVAPAVVAAFRADAAHAPDDPEYDRMARGLGAASPEFAALWARHDVGTPAQSVKSIRHPDAGDLTFEVTTLTVADRPDWYLELYNPQPDTETVERLELLLRGRPRVTCSA